jgi:predicted transport protein
MSKLIKCIETLQLSLEKHKKQDLKEYPTRTIFIDPLLEALGWDVRDPDNVELEYPTIDNKSVDYALKINHEPVLFIEAKPLNDNLDDVKAITQVVGYAANAGVEWCILTNGVKYKVYRASEKAEAPKKLLFEISLDPKDNEGTRIEQIAELFYRFSRDSMAKGVLDEIGEQIFTVGKVRKALDKIFIDPPNTFIRLIRETIDDDTIKPKQIVEAIKHLWMQTSDINNYEKSNLKTKYSGKTKAKESLYTEEFHLKNKPQEVVELYRIIDKFCRELDPNNIQRKFLKLYISYSYNKNIFCCVHIRNSGLIIWLKLDYSDLENPPDYVRDVSRIGHWGVGNVEILFDNIENTKTVKTLIQKSFEKNRET